MPRPWRPTRRCATSCGGTRARVTGGCWRLGPGERHRDTHGRGPGAPGPQAQGQEALEPGLGLEERPRGQDRQDEGRHDPSGLQARARGGSGHRRGGGRRATPGRRGRHDDAGEDAGGGQGKSRGGGRGTDGRRPGRMCDRQGLSLTVGLKGARRRPLEDADLRAQAERFCALARRRGGPPGSHQQPDPAVIGRGQGSLQAARRDRSAPLRTTSIAAACAGHGCAGARTCTSDTCSMSPATI